MDLIEHKGRINFNANESSPPEELAIEFPAISLDGQEGAPATIQKILSLIEDETIARIGIYGLGGVGKTTLVTHLFNQVRGFDYVCFSTVSRDPNYQKIQENIARDLFISWQADSVYDERVCQVYSRLQKRRFLLILDDVWAGFQLHELGIPNPNRENGCKIVVVSRSLDVCSAMGTNVNLKVEVMSEVDAWKLFLEKAGDVILLPSIQETAREVLNECGGLPLAICTIGKAMRNKDISLWQYALGTLQKSTGEVQGMKSKVFESLRLSYDFLDDATKKCFLYFSLFPEDEIIFTYFLSVNWYLEGFLGSASNFCEVDKIGSAVIMKLKEACLLEGGNYARNVTMHDLVRDMAMWITSSEHECLCLTQTGARVTEAPNEEEWQKAKRVSLMGTCIESLPDKPSCPELLTLFLEGNEKLTSIPTGFFQSMHTLQILNLSRTGISSLPPSLSLLKNLRALYFYHCKKLEDVEAIGVLSNLQVLDLYLTGVKELPEGFVNLQNLRILRLGFTLNLKKIPPNLFTSLPLLEVLNMYRSYGYWETHAREQNGSGETQPRLNLQELVDFTNLNALDITFKDSCDSLELLLKTTLVNRLEGLAVDSCLDFKGIYLLQARNLTKLRALSLQSCPEVESILCGNDINGPIFPDLRLLELHELPKLNYICRATDGHLNFLNLEKLTVSGCIQLKSIFTSALLNQLQRLNHIEVSDCGEMETIFEGQAGEESILPKLTSFSLHNLPRLSIISNGVLVLVSLEFLQVSKCPMLKKLPLDAKRSRRIKSIVGEKEWLNALVWEDQNKRAALQAFFDFSN